MQSYHKIYLASFNKAKTTKEYLKIIQEFVLDSNTQGKSDEDLIQFHKMIRSPKTGQLTTLAYEAFANSWKSDKSDLFPKTYANYMSFIQGGYELGFCSDIVKIMFAHMIRINQKDFVDKVVTFMTPHLVQRLIDFIPSYPKAIDQLPSVQAMMLFL